MTKVNTGTRFGPEPWQRDPYSDMSNEELDEHFSQLFEEHREKTVSVTLRMPEDLLRRTKRAAEAEQVPYQRLMKRLLNSALTRFEQNHKPRPATPR